MEDMYKSDQDDRSKAGGPITKSQSDRGNSEIQEDADKSEDSETEDEDQEGEN